MYYRDDNEDTNEAFVDERYKNNDDHAPRQEDDFDFAPYMYSPMMPYYPMHQHPSMMYHPQMMYGYQGMYMPYPRDFDDEDFDDYDYDYDDLSRSSRRRRRRPYYYPWWVNRPCCINRPWWGRPWWGRPW